MDRLLSQIAFLVVIIFLNIAYSASEKYSFRVSCDQNVAKLNQFWRSTGLCPPDPHEEDYKYLLSEDEKQNLALIGSIPRDGIQQVRIHWLLDLVTVQSVSGSKVTYNFTLLDQMVSLLHSNGLRPGFELMGNPSNWFTDFENCTQVYAWRDLVWTLAQRYIGLYGIDHVSTWNFESWNEPDGVKFKSLNITTQDMYGLDYVSLWNFETWNEPDSGDFDNLTLSTQGFLNYYDACSEGLKTASSRLKLGGPGDSCRDPTEKQPVKKSWSLLDHCVNGINYFTQEKGVRLDYISVHLKGSGHSMSILADEIAKITEIQLKYPHYAKIPIYNDEADPLVGWSKPEWWRADATYAAIVAKVIVQHQNLLLRHYPNINYTLLSNDNAFLNFYPSYFDQRTLVTRFQMNETKPPSVQTVKKPVLSIMGLLSLLGEQQVHVDYLSADGKGDPIGNDVDILAAVHSPQHTTSSDSWQATILIHNSADTDNTTTTDNVHLEVSGVDPSLISNKPGTSGNLVYVQYLLDNEHGNPSAVWKQFGSPIYPTSSQFKKMRQNQEPVRVDGPKSFTSSGMTFDLLLNKPGVTLFHICSKSASGPEKVTGLCLHPVTASDALVIWDDKNITSRCLLTYEVEYSPTGARETYQRINDVDLIFTAYLYSADEVQAQTDSAISGWYRVRAVDYWNRQGPYSDPVQLI